MAKTLEEALELLESGWGDPWSARSALLEALGSEESELRARALDYTSELVDSDEVARLHLEILADEAETPEIRAKAAIALGPALELCEYGWWDDVTDPPPLTQSFFDELEDRLRRLYHSADTPKLVRRRVLEAAVRAPEDWQYGAVRAAWNGRDLEWRKTAVFGMGYLGGFSELLSEALEAEDPELLAEALYAAAGRNDVPGLKSRLLGLAVDESADEVVRLAAIAGLRYVESHRARNILRKLRGHDDEDIAEMAVCALEEWEIFSRAPEIDDLDFP